MPDPRIIGGALVAVFVAALVLRLVAAGRPDLRRTANVATVLILVMMVAIIAVVVASVVSTLGQALR